MDLGVAGKNALVIAGSKGIGAGVVRCLVDEGVRVGFTSRDPAGPGVEVADMAAGFAFDTDDLEAVDPLIDRFESEVGPIDILVLNTGGPPSHDNLFDVTIRESQRAHRSLVLSPFETIRRVVPGMAERGWGRVILISSLSAVAPLDKMPLSNAYRPSMVANFTILARTYGSAGITFNTVVPGVIDTARSNIGRAEEDIDGVVALTPVGRLGAIEEVGAAVAFLSSQRAAFVTGARVPVDGGLAIQGQFPR